MMKKSLQKVLSLVLALVMLLSVCSAGIVVAAAQEAQSGVAVPGIQTMLTDGQALKNYLETNFLNLEQADKLLSDNLPNLAQTLCAQLGDLFYQMGYTEGEYPADEDGLQLALARVLGSLNAEVFREPEKVETTDLSLVYNLAYLGGTAYIESINAALPEALRFDTQTPVLALSAAQQAEIEDYYAKWKAGDLNLSDFDVRNYLGEMTPTAYLKTVLLVFVADEQRLPAIIKTAVDFTLTAEHKQALAQAVADILDALHTAPVSAILKVLSDERMHGLLRAVLETANRVTVRTDYYAYQLFQEGIYADTDGTPIPFAEQNEDGSYSYIGPSMVSEYLAAADALFDFLAGIYPELQSSVLESVLSTRWSKLSALAAAALDAGAATIGAQQSKLQSDIQAAQIEARVAQAKIDAIDSGEARQTAIAKAQAALDAAAAEISALQERLSALESEEAVAKNKVKGYYDTLAEFEAQMNEETRAQIEADPAYIEAKAVVEQTEAALADNLNEQSAIKAQIAQKSAAADDIAAQLEALQNAYAPEQEKAVYQKMIQSAQKVITDSQAALADLPDTALIDAVVQTLSPLLKSLLGAFEGVYDTMMQQTPAKALVALVYGLKDFVDEIENIDWDAIAPVTDPLFAQLDAYIDGAAGRYIGAGGGENILADLSAFINEFLDNYGVYNYIKVDYLNRFISEELLGDNSAVMQQAAAALAGMFPSVQPSYESIVSCFIPLLSSLNWDYVMGNLTNIPAIVNLATPSAFAYIAGLESDLLEENYLDTINSNLVQFGYEGSPVVPMIDLTPAQQAKLLAYVALEKEGKTLDEIAEAGFNWKDFTGDTSNLDIANAFIKIAIADNDKLGKITSQPGLGTALTKLLCDLLNDLKSAPVTTILKKVSDAEGISAIVDLAMSLFNGEDDAYKSFDMYFNDKIYFDGEGNTTFYDAFDKEGVLQYTGPKTMEQYVPVIAAVIDFLSGLDADVEKNEGDLLKTLLYDKIPQLKNLIKSVISYDDAAGKEQAGLLFYLLLGYGDYLKAENLSLCYDVLISLANKRIADTAQGLEQANEKIAKWEDYLVQAKAASEAAKLAEAKKAGLLPAEATAFDEAAVTAALEAKIASLRAELAALETAIAQDEADIAAAQAEVGTAQDAVAAAQADLEAAQALADYPYSDPFYIDLLDIFDTQDASMIDTLRDDCEEEFNENFGAGKFDELVDLITENLEDYDADSFIEECILNGGLYINEAVVAAEQQKADAQALLTSAQAAVTTAQQALKDDQAAVEAKSTALAQYESGAVSAAIAAAGEDCTIALSDTSLPAIGDYTVKDIEEAIAIIRNETVAQIDAEVAAQNELIAAYRAEQAAADSAKGSFNPALIPLAATASDVIADGLIAVMMGDAADGSENVYHYIMNRDVIGILTSGGRLQALVEMVVGIYEPALNALVSEGILDAQTARQLIAATPDFEPFYTGALAQFPEQFKQNPVGAVGNLILALTQTIKSGFLALEEAPVHDVLQLKKINSDVGDIFDEAFADDWAASYSRSVVDRIGEIYQLLVDLLGLSFIKELVGERAGTEGNLSGKIDTARLYTDVVVQLYQGETLVASCEVKKDSDGSFRFTGIAEGRYELRLETRTGVAFEIKAIDIIGDDTTDLTAHARDGLDLIAVSLGDVNGDKVVNLEDIALLLQEDAFGTAAQSYDINCDGCVDIADVSVILSAANYGAQAQSVVY